MATLKFSKFALLWITMIPSSLFGVQLITKMGGGEANWWIPLTASISVANTLLWTYVFVIRDSG